MRKWDLLGPLTEQTSLLIERLFLDSRHLRWVEINLNIWTYMRNWLYIYTLSKLASFTSRLKQQNLLSSINTFSYIFAFCLYQRRLVMTTWNSKSKNDTSSNKIGCYFSEFISGSCEQNWREACQASLEAPRSSETRGFRLLSLSFTLPSCGSHLKGHLMVQHGCRSCSHHTVHQVAGSMGVLQKHIPYLLVNPFIMNLPRSFTPNTCNDIHCLNLRLRP